MTQLTLLQLRRKKACYPQRLLFAQRFGRSVDITEELCARYCKDFSWYWASCFLLTDDQFDIYRAEKIKPTDFSWPENEARAFARAYNWRAPNDNN